MRSKQREYQTRAFNSHCLSLHPKPLHLPTCYISCRTAFNSFALHTELTQVLATMANMTRDAPESMFPLPSTFIPEHHAADMMMSLDRWTWFKNKEAIISETPLGEDCGICRCPLDPINGEPLTLAENTPENRMIISPNICMCNYHVGCLKRAMKDSTLCPYCRQELLKPAEGPHLLFQSLRTELRTRDPLTDASVRIRSDKLAGHILLAAFAILSMQDQPCDGEVITSMFYEGEECPVLAVEYPLRIISSPRGRGTVEVMVRAAYKTNIEERMTIAELRTFLVKHATEELMGETDGSWPWFSGLLADMSAQAYAVTVTRNTLIPV